MGIEWRGGLGRGVGGGSEGVMDVRYAAAHDLFWSRR